MPRAKNTENPHDLTTLSELSWASIVPADNRNQDHCYMCLKRGQLILCDYCPRSICLKCVTVPPDSKFISKVTFLCLLCHEKTFRGLQPYHGFYITKGVAVNSDGGLKADAFVPNSNSPLQVTGKFYWTAHSQISNQPLLILHFVLDHISSIGSPSGTLAEFLRGFLYPSQFYFDEIRFDFSNNILIDNHQKKLRMLCQSHGSCNGRALIFVSTRCHQEKLAMSLDSYTSIKKFFDLILPSDCVKFLENKEVTLWLLSGGAAFQDDNWNREFSSTFERVSLSHFITFTAEDFHPPQASILLLGYGQRTILEQMSLPKCLEQLLPIDFSLSRQTDIRLCSRSNSKVNHVRYSWVQEEIKPWGHDLPVQCSRCGSIRSWVASKLSGKCIFSCKVQSCESRLMFSPPKEIKWSGKSVAGGRWLVTDLSNL